MLNFLDFSLQATVVSSRAWVHLSRPFRNRN